MVSKSSEAVISLPISLSSSTFVMRSRSARARASADSARSCASRRCERSRSFPITRRRWTRSTTKTPAASMAAYSPNAHHVMYHGGRIVNAYAASPLTWP